MLKKLSVLLFFFITTLRLLALFIPYIFQSLRSSMNNCLFFTIYIFYMKQRCHWALPLLVFFNNLFNFLNLQYYRRLLVLANIVAHQLNAHILIRGVVAFALLNTKR